MQDDLFLLQPTGFDGLVLVYVKTSSSYITSALIMLDSCTSEKLGKCKTAFLFRWMSTVPYDLKRCTKASHHSRHCLLPPSQRTPMSLLFMGGSSVYIGCHLCAQQARLPNTDYLYERQGPCVCTTCSFVYASWEIPFSIFQETMSIHILLCYDKSTFNKTSSNSISTNWQM